METAMKRITLALLATLAVSSHAFAGEEINVAAAIGSGASTTTSTMAEAGTVSTTTAAATTANMIAAGIITAAGIAAVSQAGGTTSH